MSCHVLFRTYDVMKNTVDGVVWRVLGFHKTLYWILRSWDLITFAFWILLLNKGTSECSSISDLQSRTCRVQRRGHTQCFCPGSASAVAPLSAADLTPHHEWPAHMQTLLAASAFLDSEHYAFGTTPHPFCSEEKLCAENDAREKMRDKNKPKNLVQPVRTWLQLW